MLQLHHSALKYGLFTAIMAAAMLAGATARADRAPNARAGKPASSSSPWAISGNATDTLTGLGAVSTHTKSAPTT